MINIIRLGFNSDITNLDMYYILHNFNTHFNSSKNHENCLCKTFKEISKDISLNPIRFKKIFLNVKRILKYIKEKIKYKNIMNH